MNLFSNIYKGCNVLLTGHTGFKGSWLALWLVEMGAQVTGVAYAPDTTPNHWDLMQLNVDHRELDIRDASALQAVISEVKPEIVFHLAAQSLVKKSYTDPVATWSTNVMGTVNLLEACRQTSSVKAVICVTSDKCYENRELCTGYKENDRLGGHDPYSASKACCELVVESYRKSFINETSPMLATARAGNVIGGGDWSKNRLLPDLISAVFENRSLEIRSPNATRPWQHVLESLSGYLLLGQKLLEEKQSVAAPWNFGPDKSGVIPVEQLLALVKKEWEQFRWHVIESKQHEATFLNLNSAKARQELQWLPVWDLPKGLKQTVKWYYQFLHDGEVISREQLVEYIRDAQNKKLVWAQ